MTSSSTSVSSLDMVVTPDDLARAFDKIGLTGSVSATSRLKSKTPAWLRHPNPPQIALRFRVSKVVDSIYPSTTMSPRCSWVCTYPTFCLVAVRLLAAWPGVQVLWKTMPRIPFRVMLDKFNINKAILTHYFLLKERKGEFLVSLHSFVALLAYLCWFF